MATDNAKLNYLNTWDIDQLVATNTVSVGVGTTAVYTIPATLPSIPAYEVQLLVGGRYYQSGTFATSNTIATLQNFSTYVQSGVIYITTSVAGTARYFVWQDKVNY